MKKVGWREGSLFTWQAANGGEVGGGKSLRASRSCEG